MTVVLTVGDLLAAFRPVAEQMLRPDEFRTARFWVAPYDDRELHHDDAEVVDDCMSVAWKIMGNRGSSRSLGVEVDDLAELLYDLADDLQDFIAESAFAWGELRPIPPLGQ